MAKKKGSFSVVENGEVIRVYNEKSHPKLGAKEQALSFASKVKGRKVLDESGKEVSE